MSASFDDLLEIQAHDTKLDQLRRQLDALPERLHRDSLGSALTATATAIEEQRAARTLLARDQKRLDDEIETINVRRKHEEATLYGGSVTNARALQDLQEELEALGRRVTVLEDKDLEIMEQIEPIDARLGELETEHGTLAADLASAEQALTVAEAELAVQVEAEKKAREALAADFDATLLGEYESLRAGRGGIGVARLVGSQCGGCHLGLSAVEVARVRKLGSGEITHCEECGRLLVP